MEVTLLNGFVLAVFPHPRRRILVLHREFWIRLAHGEYLRVLHHRPFDWYRLDSILTQVAPDDEPGAFRLDFIDIIAHGRQILWIRVRARIRSRLWATPCVGVTNEEELPDRVHEP